jgi:hypothetical protein
MCVCRKGGTCGRDSMESVGRGLTPSLQITQPLPREMGLLACTSQLHYMQCQGHRGWGHLESSAAALPDAMSKVLESVGKLVTGTVAATAAVGGNGGRYSHQINILANKSAHNLLSVQSEGRVPQVPLREVGMWAQQCIQGCTQGPHTKGWVCWRHRDRQSEGGGPAQHKERANTIRSKSWLKAKK